MTTCSPHDFTGTLVHVPGRSFGAFTNASGRFELTYLPEATYDVVAMENGRRLKILENVSVSAAGVTDLGGILTSDVSSDPANCGACGRACGLGQTCNLSSCCGDGVLDAHELCDRGIAPGLPGACPGPADCDDGMACTTDELIGTACQVQCRNLPITSPHDGDGCCPPGGNAGNDSDCASACGDGLVSPGEACDIGISSGPGKCPTSCDDAQACTVDVLLGGGTCQARCHYTQAGPSPISDGCCPDGANSNNDADCAPVCGNGVVESGEQCDPPGAGCDDQCQQLPQGPPPAAFRITQMYLRDPHEWINLFGCRDWTDTPLTGDLAVNIQINKQLQGDENGDGFYDMSPVLLFDSLGQQDGSEAQVDLVYARCTVGASSTCSVAGLDRQQLAATSRGTGTCLDVLPGTTGAYSPPVAFPANQCFATMPRVLPISLQGTTVILYEARVGAVYQNDPATGLTTGLIRGFVTEADAENTVVPIPVIGDIPLAKLLPGGRDNCSSGNDKDTNSQGQSGWWFYLNFSAAKTPYTN